jgi:multidrug transporter EmrE-like cation transporter
MPMDYVAQLLSRVVRPWFETPEAPLFMAMVIMAAIFFTVGGIFMKLSDGLTRAGPTFVVFALFVAGASLQTIAMKREDLAVTYLIVVGLESILAFLFGVLLFDESCSKARVLSVALIAGGIVSLRLSS